MNNKVELIGWYGSDEIIACSAWTSTSRNLDDKKRERIPKLIKQLWSADPVPHGTPFEKGIVHFLVNTDIASHIHLLKHRISSINAESARYKELKEDKYYIPEDWINISISQKSCENISGIDKFRLFNMDIIQSDNRSWIEMLQAYTELGNNLYHQCINDLEPILGRKRAKESARFFKTYNSQIEADVMFNMRSFHNFLTQRIDGHAQLEIQEIGKQMLQLIKDIPEQPFKYTLEAFGF